MEWIATLGRTMGFSFAAGINLYATVAILGLASRYNWVTLPEQYRAFDNDFIIVTALVLGALMLGWRALWSLTNPRQTLHS